MWLSRRTIKAEMRQYRERARPFLIALLLAKERYDPPAGTGGYPHDYFNRR
jgi:hypothetical protein